MIVPLLSGSGMRVKILEGMALNRVVISTSIGMEGIEATNKKEIVTADSPQEFVEMIDWVSKDLSKQEEIGNNARNFIVNYFDRETNTKKLINFLKS
jgi:glycosyltransferase involved in cell wall biosynthesis